MTRYNENRQLTQDEMIRYQALEYEEKTLLPLVLAYKAKCQIAHNLADKIIFRGLCAGKTAQTLSRAFKKNDEYARQITLCDVLVSRTQPYKIPYHLRYRAVCHSVRLEALTLANKLGEQINTVFFWL